MKKQNLWVIKDPKGRFIWRTISITRRECIDELLFHHVNWKFVYRGGYRAEKIVITTCFCDGAGECFEGISD